MVSFTKFNIQALSVQWPRLILIPSTDRYTVVAEWLSLIIRDATVQTALIYGSFSYRKARLLAGHHGALTADDR